MQFLGIDLQFYPIYFAPHIFYGSIIVFYLLYHSRQLIGIEFE